MEKPDLSFNGYVRHHLGARDLAVNTKERHFCFHGAYILGILY